MKRAVCVFAVLVVLATMAIPGKAATAFASPAFETQWKAGEATLPNFYGPLTLARDGQQEPYKEATGGTRLVQYFDKARMELGGNGSVTSGLLATELVTGKVQTGDNSFESRPPPAINIAGDTFRAGGVTYADLAGRAASLLTPAASAVGKSVTQKVGETGGVTAGTLTGSMYSITMYDAPTQHNVPQAFADLRTRVGLDTVGYAISEPFAARVFLGEGMVQVFQRRVLTYTPDNPEAFRVEFGNIGQHYYQWRYGTANTAAMTAVPTATLSGTLVATATPTATAITTPRATAIAATATVPMPTATQAIATVPMRTPLSAPLSRSGPVEIYEVSLTRMVKRSTSAMYIVQTNPGAQCTINANLRTTKSGAAGLVPKTADAAGIVSWTWLVESDAPTGAWTVNVSCKIGMSSPNLSTTYVVE